MHYVYVCIPIFPMKNKRNTPYTTFLKNKMHKQNEFMPFYSRPKLLT